MTFDEFEYYNSRLEQMWKLDQEVYDKSVELNEDDENNFLDFKAVYSLFYKKFIGMTERDIHRFFSTRSNNIFDNNAWYDSKTNRFNEKELEYNNCYIPDAIENLLLHSRFNSKEKYRQLCKMMNDLKKLKKLYLYRDELFND